MTTMYNRLQIINNGGNDMGIEEKMDNIGNTINRKVEAVDRKVDTLLTEKVVSSDFSIAVITCAVLASLGVGVIIGWLLV